MSKFKIEIKWGVFFTIATLAWMAIEKELGWHDELIAKHAIYTNFFAIMAVILFVFAIKDKKENYYNGQMTWTEGMISGSLVSVVVAVLAPLTQYITHNFITPEFFENAIALTVENDRMTKEGAEAYFNLRSYIIQSVFGALAMGVVTSAIVALFFRSKKKDAKNGDYKP